VDPIFVRPAQAAALLAVGRSTVYTWIRSGALPAHKARGGITVLRYADVVEFADRIARASPTGPKTTSAA
jgi:excisionase family DNA binding protein